MRRFTIATALLLMFVAALPMIRQTANAAEVEAATRPASDWSQYNGRTLKVDLASTKSAHSGIASRPVIIDQQVYLVLVDHNKIQYLINVKEIAVVTVYPDTKP